VAAVAANISKKMTAMHVEVTYRALLACPRVIPSLWCSAGVTSKVRRCCWRSPSI